MIDFCKDISRRMWAAMRVATYKVEAAIGVVLFLLILFWPTFLTKFEVLILNYRWALLPLALVFGHLFLKAIYEKHQDLKNEKDDQIKQLSGWRQEEQQQYLETGIQSEQRWKEREIVFGEQIRKLEGSLDSSGDQIASLTNDRDDLKAELVAIRRPKLEIVYDNAIHANTNFGAYGSKYPTFAVAVKVNEDSPYEVRDVRLVVHSIEVESGEEIDLLEFREHSFLPLNRSHWINNERTALHCGDSIEFGVVLSISKIILHLDSEVQKFEEALGLPEDRSYRLMVRASGHNTSPSFATFLTYLKDGVLQFEQVPDSKDEPIGT